MMVAFFATFLLFPYWREWHFLPLSNHQRQGIAYRWVERKRTGDGDCHV